MQGAQRRFAPTYRSYIITRDDTGIESAHDLEGRSFAWVDPASTSGYLFPRAHLIQELAERDMTNETIDDFFGQVIYAGGHDAAVRAVINRDVDAAAASDSQVMRMRASVEILARLGLEEQALKRAGQLSGGQKQRVGIARAMRRTMRLGPVIRLLSAKGP